MISYCVAVYRPIYARLLLAELVEKTSVPFEILVWLNVADTALDAEIAAATMPPRKPAFAGLPRSGRRWRSSLSRSNEHATLPIGAAGSGCERISTQKQKGAAGLLPPRPFVYLAGPGAETPVAKPEQSLAGDPSEVTALGIRHWITSFRC
jgi:hypothetical protein